MKDAKNATYALILLTAVNYLNYIDRYILASMLPYIKEELALSDFQLGLLSSAFIYPYLLVAPVFGILGDKIRRNVLSSLGIAIWSLATVFTGLSPNYAALMGSRMFLGIGEASFSVVAPAWLADFFGPQNRGRVMAIFAAALPVGAAIGYILGGVFGDSIGWRMGFMLVGGPGLIMAVLIYLLKDTQAEERMTASSEASKTGLGKAAEPKFSLEIFKNLFLNNAAFRNVVLGYCAYTFVVGGLAHWMPIYLDRFYKPDMGDLPAGVVFGAVAAISGLIGTIVGGFAADRWDQKSGNGYTKLSALSMWLSIPPFFVAVYTQSYSVFMVSLFCTMLMMFISTSPINVMILNAVSLSWRSTAMAMAIFACHFLGDAISTPFVGYISDNYGGLKVGVMATIPFAGICALYWTWVVMKHLRTIPIYENPVPKGIHSHRGYRGDPNQSVANGAGGHAENSTGAVHFAFQNGYDVCEVDVRLSADGVAVLSHDEELEPGQTVSSLSAQQLAEKYSIETLEDLIDRNDSGWLNLELKWQQGREKQVVEVVTRVVNSSGAKDRILISSFHPGILRKASRSLKQIPRGIIVSKDSGWGKWTMFWGRPHFIHVEDHYFSDQQLVNFVERGVPVVVWTVNDSERAKHLLSLGIHGVISDHLTP